VNPELAYTVKLLDSNTYTVIKGSSIFLGKINMAAQSFFTSKSNLAKLGHCYGSHQERLDK
jgi:hypothetical protein